MNGSGRNPGAFVVAGGDLSIRADSNLVPAARVDREALHRNVVGGKRSSDAGPLKREIILK